MKFCLSSRQTPEYLQKADEIKVAFRDRESIMDLAHDYPDKTFILDCFGVSEIDWKEVGRLNVLAHENLIVCVNNIDQMRSAHAIKVKRYLGYPVSSFFELNALTVFDPEYILLDTGLFFRMDKVVLAGVPVRAVPNVAYNDGLPHANGIAGMWIRPEDLESVYGEYISAVEFADCDREKEQALYRIYAEKKEWRQELQALITNLDAEGLNRMISSSVSRSRTTCEHKCQVTGNCHICERAFLLADPELIQSYRDAEKVES